MESDMPELFLAIYTQFWHDVLDRFNATNLLLQKTTTTLKTAEVSLNSLKQHVDAIRVKYETYESAVKEMSGNENYAEGRVRVPNVRLNPVGFKKIISPALPAGKKIMNEAVVPVIDKLINALEERIMAYRLTCDRFGFLAEFNSNPSELELAAEKLVAAYPDDLDNGLGNEMVQLFSFAKQFQRSDNISFELHLYNLILKKHMQNVFVNAEIALRIYLSLMISNATGERSFSKMKLIKHRLRTSMKNERLSNLTLLSCEYDILKELSADDIIDKFSANKNRKKML